MNDKDNFASIGLDKRDRRIMYELDCNSRQSNSAIAKKLGLGKNLVNYRIKRMVENGVIKGFYTAVDEYKLGHTAVRVYLKWGFVSKAKEREMVEFISRNPQVWWVGTISGEWNLGFVTSVLHFRDFEQFWFDFMDRYQMYVQSRVVAIYSKLWDCSYAFISPEQTAKRPHQAMGNSGNERLSKKEFMLLQVIAENARIPIADLAKKTGLSISGAKGMIKRLCSRGVIKGFRAIFDTEKLGYTYFKLDFFLRDSKYYEKMLQFALAHPNVIYVNKTVGYADFEFDIMLRSHSELQNFVANFGELFGESITEYRYFVYEKNPRRKHFSLIKPSQ